MISVVIGALVSVVVSVTMFLIGEARGEARGKTQAEKLARIEGAISTRYLAKFPAFVPDVIDLISHAHTKVMICTDYVAYAALLDPADAQRYLDTLAAAASKLTLITMDDDHLKRFTTRLVGDNKGEIRPDRRADVRDFVTRFGSPTEITSVTLSGFIAARLAHEKEALTQCGISGTRVAQEIPLYFWIAEEGTSNARAIFSIAALGPDAVEHGFVTADPSLIAAFGNLGRRLCNDSALTAART